MRYGTNGYFWINDTKPKMIMHPIKPSLNNKNVANVQDKKGKYLFKEFVTVTNNNENGALVKYMWPKPNFEEPQEKFSYVQKFGPWNWIIGTGAYIDDIKAKIAKYGRKHK